jgi:hypothetical protein
MKIKIAFDDWKKNGVSIYSTEKGLDLSTGVFHSGTVFDAEINLDPSSEEELRQALKEKCYPTFLVFQENRKD